MITTAEWFATRPVWRPTARAFAVLIGLALFMDALGLAVAYRRAHLSQPTQLAHLSDGPSFCVVGGSMVDGRPYSTFDKRVFLGLPLVLSLGLRMGMSPEAFGLVLSTCCVCGMLCVLAALLKDMTVSMLLAVFPPQWTMDRSLVMNEALLLALCVLGVWIVLRLSPRWWAAGALCLAYATVVRPNAVFAAAGVFFALLLTRRTRDACVFAAWGLLLTIAVHGLVSHFYWSVLENSRIYRSETDAYGTGSVLTYPLGSFVLAVRSGDWRQLQFWYKGVHAAGAIVLASYLVVKARRNPTTIPIAFAIWAVLGVWFSVSVGSFWGVRIIHRSLTWTYPPLAYAASDWLPRVPPAVWVGGLMAVSVLFLLLAPYTVG